MATRTKFPLRSDALPAKNNADIEKISIDEMIDDLTNTEKANLLRIQTEVQTRLINVKTDIYHIGKLLYEAKQILPHGKFTAWIRHFFENDLPYSTAAFYMRVYDVFKEKPSTIQYIPTQYLLMITQKQFPEEIIKLLSEHPDKIHPAQLQQINEAYNSLKNGSIGGSQLIQIAREQINIGLQIARGHTEHRINANMRLSFEWGAGDILKRIQALRKTARNLASVYPHDPDSREHKKLIAEIHKTIEELKGLEIDLEGDRGLFKKISTKDGNKYI
jgi:hypothetical protein